MNQSTDPELMYFSIDSSDTLADFLSDHGWTAPNEVVREITKAGDGNMNLTLRVKTDRGSVILKQSRPWVEKYPQVAAPVERIVFERRFYERVVGLPGAGVAGMMPRVLGADDASHTLLLEDLGEASDFTDVYRGGNFRGEEIDVFARWSAALHEATCGQPDPAFANRAMRALNHQHIFVLPLTDGLPVPLDDLEPGLGDAAAALRRNTTFAAETKRLGELYLADGPCLLHGDYYPGSWLRTANGVRVIDPEFCFYGPPEFEVAVPLAHLALAGSPWTHALRWLDAYRHVNRQPLDESLIAGFAGTEVMRRLIGLAQLPIPPENGRRVALLRRAETAVCENRLEALW